jgi:hypothetical protein
MMIHGSSLIRLRKLCLQKAGSNLTFPSSYTLALQSRLSEEEFRSIIQSLNATALEYGPKMGGCTMALMLIPCTAFCTVVSLKSQVGGYGCLWVIALWKTFICGL